jgi:hypothetical protein
MRGFVVGSDGNPVQFRVHDPSTGQTSMAIMVVRGGALSMVDVLPSQFTSTAPVQHQPVPGRRVGVMEGEMGLPPLQENGIVAPDQVMPTGVTAPAAPEQPANADGGTGNQGAQQEVGAGAGAAGAAGVGAGVLQGAAAEL